MLGVLAKIASSRPIAVHVGLLAIRVGIGTSMLALHGWGKIQGGPELWSRLGGAMGQLGIDFAPTLWGFLAAFAEFGCSILIILGVLFRAATGMLAFTMFVAVLRHLNLPADNDASGWSGASHALEFLTVYVGLLLAGPGKYALGTWGRKTDMIESS